MTGRPINARRIVKEAFDNLPEGICFFSRSGLPVLCNRTMNELAFALAGRDLQSLAELQAILESPPRSNVVRDGRSYLLPDGSVWQFSLGQVRNADGDEYTRVTAFEVGDLYRGTKETEQSVEQLRDMSAHIQSIIDNVAAVTREEELLAMRMQIHDRLGSSLLKLRRYKLDGGIDRDELLSDWRQSVALLLREGGTERDADPYPELIRSAASIGVEIVVEGELPGGGIRALIAQALRQCVTNAVRHADSSHVYMTICDDSDEISAVITNDGEPPAGEITEGGGLSSLRRQIESVGGGMEVHGSPRFELKVTIPKSGAVIL